MQLDSKEIVDSCLILMDEMVATNKALKKEDDKAFAKSRMKRYKELMTLSHNIEKNVILFSTELFDLQQEILKEIALIQTKLSANETNQEDIDNTIDELNEKSVLFIQHILMTALGDDAFYQLAAEKKLLKNKESKD